MGAIRCAWGHVHDTVAEVRECDAAHRSGAPDQDAAGPDPDDGRDAAGPDWLGRDAVVGRGQEVPDAWQDAPRVLVDDDFLAKLRADPPAMLGSLWERRHRRERTVFERDDPVDLPPGRAGGPVWSHAPDELLADDFVGWFLTSNAVDLRPGRRQWPWADRAIAAGARRGGPADVVLPDGTPAWCDGGPPTRFAASVTGGVAVVHRVALERGSLIPFTLGPDPGDAGTTLAPDQQAAVAHQGGAARIIAPAGSGKTRVLTERARRLLTTWQVPASSLCLVAFNTRAADEMRSRARDLPGLHVRTLNALGLAILNGEAPFARRGARYGVVEEAEVRAALDGLVKPARAPGTDPLATWLSAISEVRLCLRDPGDVEIDFAGDVEGLPDVVRRYRELLASRRAVDFDEQIAGAIEVLLEEPETRAVAQRACRFLLVDEFQDLAPAHLLLVRLLASPELSVFGVGDDDQTIYGFSGATPRWLIGYAALFPGAGDHPLTANYRCPPDVVQAADLLLRHNRARVPKEIHSVEPTARPHGLVIRPSDNPTVATADAVAAHLSAGAGPEQVAVLARVNSVLLGPQVELRRRGIPVVNAVRVSWLQQRTGVRAALAWLRLAASPERLRRDDVAEAARRPSQGRSRTLIGWMAEQRSIDALHGLGDRLKADRDVSKVESFAGLLERLARRLDGTTDGLVATLVELRRTGLDETLGVLDRYRQDATRAAHLDDLDTLVDLARICPEPGRFPEWLHDELSRPDDPSGVRLATVHRVKGLEWPHVVVHGASDALFPHRLTSNADALEEERRVFHVAITRCSATCTIVVPDGAASPFVDELQGRSPTIRVVAAPNAAATTKTAEPKKPKRSGPAPPLEQALRTWRGAQAKREGRPAFVIFHDSTLVEIADRRPATLAELARVSGVGPAKLERYGDDILAVVAADETN